MQDVTGAVQRHLLLIDRDPRQTRLITAAVSQAGWRTICVPDADVALAVVAGPEGQHLAAVVLDHCTVAESALPVVAQINRLRDNLPVVMLTGSIDARYAVEAMKAGVSDYLLKPVTRDRLLGSLRLATNRDTSSSELQPLSEELDAAADFNAIVGSDPALRFALAHAALAARSASNVLVEGEGGTGRTTLIRAMHQASPRAKAPIMVINARSFTEAGLMSALFGHHKGAFPGAFEQQAGAFQLCDNGTLVLQEVSRLPRIVQAQLAKSIAEARIWPVGASCSYAVDVRVLASSSQPVAQLVEADKFDKALFEALAQTRICLPPLRQRAGDIPALARNFMSRLKELTSSDLSINDDALRLLTAYAWPGNVRQLQAVLLRASAMCEGAALTAKDLPALSDLTDQVNGQQLTPTWRPQQHGVSLFRPDGHVRSLEEIETDVIRLALGRYGGRMAEVARRLGLSRSTLYRKLSNDSAESTSNDS